jgi:outer membrane protein assembly factor BamB
MWQFPEPGGLPTGQRFAADDAFVAPDGKTVVANDEAHQVVDRIDIATDHLVWQYGHYGVAGAGRGYLHNPDDAYPLANGDIVVADIDNCRILEIAPSKKVVRTFGRTGVCVDHAPSTFGTPNGDTPLPDGGLLITEIRGSRVVRLSADGKVVFDIRVPARYPSDAQLDPDGNVVVADYSNPGQVIDVTPTGHVLWRYGPRTGSGRLDHPSLATPLADGMVSINDDFRHRVVVLDPRTMRIVWQYGHTGVAGRGPGYLSIPDGHQPIPAGLTF